MTLPLTPDSGIDFSPLQLLLTQQAFQDADLLTRQLMAETVSKSAVKRGWLYFSEIDRIPVADLLTLDRMWGDASGGKFGFSVQRTLWLGVRKDWDKLWPLIGWKQGNRWTRYPQEFIWDLSAPQGHLPLSNQLRGVQVFAALLNHAAWQLP